MTKFLSCRDAGVDCDYVAQGETDEEVLEKVAEHAKKDHDIDDPRDYLDYWRKKIKTN